MAKWDFKDVALAVIYSYVLVTILNYLVHYAFGLPILKTGVAILIFCAGVILSTIFVFTRDGSFGKDDVRGLLVVIAVVIGIYLAFRYLLPDLFSLFPQATKEAFSFLN